VRVRPRLDLQPAADGTIDPAAYGFYEKEMTYRWAFICRLLRGAKLGTWLVEWCLASGQLVIRE
jgi:hypothetical protein